MTGTIYPAGISLQMLGKIKSDRLDEGVTENYNGVKCSYHERCGGSHG